MHMYETAPVASLIAVLETLFHEFADSPYGKDNLGFPLASTIDACVSTHMLIEHLKDSGFTDISKQYMLESINMDNWYAVNQRDAILSCY